MLICFLNLRESHFLISDSRIKFHKIHVKDIFLDGIDLTVDLNSIKYGGLIWFLVKMICQKSPIHWRNYCRPSWDLRINITFALNFSACGYCLRGSRVLTTEHHQINVTSESVYPNFVSSIFTYSLLSPSKKFFFFFFDPRETIII